MGTPSIWVLSVGRICCAPLLGWLLQIAGVDPLVANAGGLEITERGQSERSLLFALNHSDQVRALQLDVPYRNLLTGADAAGVIPVEPHDLLILERVRARIP
ncbi:MAG: Beta-galactosidase C-terminal domain [Anaerolineae bacterium]